MITLHKIKVAVNLEIVFIFHLSLPKLSGNFDISMIFCLAVAAATGWSAISSSAWKFGHSLDIVWLVFLFLKAKILKALAFSTEVAVSFVHLGQLSCSCLYCVVTINSPGSALQISTFCVLQNDNH